MASTSADYTPRTPQPSNVPTMGPIPLLSSVNTLAGPLHSQVTSHPPPASECLHLALDGENAPVGIVPCLEHPGMNRRTVFGLKLSTSAQRGNDLFYSENKYPEDEPYKEMDENSRFWKTCVDEGMKIDAGKVIDWTDALDVLLVFAGLFSAVVSTFVCQTFQTLEVDPTDVLTSLVSELLAVTRAIDEHGPGSSKDVAPADTSFHATRTATWVNGLWYVSLTLSLTTALIAALTKQWIHQYMNYAQLGTPRARARVRHFRFLQLQAWHVPAIIGLLPVMMHIALGLFLSGLIIHIRALNTVTCFVVGGLVFLTLLIYGGTNLFPVYNPACPYKTPLSHYAYLTVRRISGLWEFVVDYILFHKFGLSSNTASALLPVCAKNNAASISLVDSEEVLVETAAASRSLDAQVAAWLYSTSSNSSVQNIMLQALGNLPLHAMQIVKDSVGAGALENVLSRALNSPDFLDPSRMSAYERLLRSLYRLFPDTSTTFLVKPNTSLSRLLDIGRPHVAADFIRDQLLAPYQEYDPAIWVQILANAFSSGPDWLLESPVHWQTLVSWFTGEHKCSMCLNGVNTSRECYTLLLTVVHPSRPGLQGTYGRRFLTVIDDGASPDRVMNLQDAMDRFLGPSICDLMLYIAYPSSNLTIRPKAIPSDIRLRLALIQTEWIWRTGSSSPDNASPIANLIRSIRVSVGVDGTIGAHSHGGIMRATFDALKDVIVTDLYGMGSVSTAYRQRLLHPFFRSLAAAEENLLPHYQSWMTDSIATTIVEMVFAEPVPVVLPLISDLLVATVRAACPVLLPKICIELCKREWLDVVGHMFFDETPWDSEVSASMLQKRSYTLMLAAYIEALYVLRDNLPPTYSEVLVYTQKPSNLLTLCRILLLSDVERWPKLWRLAPLIGRSQWAACFGDMGTFITAEGTRNIYKAMISAPLHPYQNGRRLIYPPIEELPCILSRFKRHVETHLVDCNCHPISPCDVPNRTKFSRWTDNSIGSGHRSAPSDASSAQNGSAMV